MSLDVRVAQNQVEDLLRDTILYALGVRLPSVSGVAALRAFASQGASGSIRNDDDLITIVSGGAVTSSFRWSKVSSASDDGVNVIKPTDVSANGRWLLWTSPLRIIQTVGASSMYLHEIGAGAGYLNPLKRVIVLDKETEIDDLFDLIQGQIPAAVILAGDDIPEAMQLGTGYRWNTTFNFTISVITQNLRDRREHAHGQDIASVVELGANALDGLIQSVLAGIQLSGVIGEIRNVKLGRGNNWFTDEGQRRIVRERDYAVQATVLNPAAPNDSSLITESDNQSEMTDLNDQTAWDDNNYVVSGCDVAIGTGLSKTVNSGSVIIAGATVTYAGELPTFAASSDTYRDLLPNGTMTFVAVETNTLAPAVTAAALRIGVTTTDGSSVISDRFIAAIRTPYVNPYQVSLS